MQIAVSPFGPLNASYFHCIKETLQWVAQYGTGVHTEPHSFLRRPSHPCCGWLQGVFIVSESRDWVWPAVLHIEHHWPSFTDEEPEVTQC